MLRSETTNFFGRPSSGAVPSACARARDRTESRVTPGKITIEMVMISHDDMAI